MAKKRDERPNGTLRKLKKGAWSLSYWVDVMAGDGEIQHTRRSEQLGVHATKTLARDAADRFLSTLPVTVAEARTVRQFVQHCFLPEYVSTLKQSTQMHYRTVLTRHILPALGDKRMDHVGFRDVQDLVNFKKVEQRDFDGKLIRKALSNQSVIHIRNVISACFKHAKVTGQYLRENPAKGVRTGSMNSKPRHAFTVEEAGQLISALPTPAREMAMIAATTSLNRAEFLGLRWQRVNLTEEATMTDERKLYPHSLLVLENAYKGVLDTTKTPRRIRIVPLPRAVWTALQALKDKSPWTEPADLVFCGQQRGQPMHIRNLEARVFEPAIRKLGFPLGTGWHSFRRSWATMADDLGFEIADRIAGMGHTDFGMTLRYTQTNVERRRAGNELISDLVILEPSAQMDLFDQADAQS